MNRDIIQVLSISKYSRRSLGYALTEKGVLWQCDDTHQNLVEICPIKKYSYSVERSKRKEEWVRDEGLIER